MGYFQVRYDSRVVNYDHRGFIRLATGAAKNLHGLSSSLRGPLQFFISLYVSTPSPAYSRVAE